MTNEKIIDLAREAGFSMSTLGWTYTQGVINEHLTKFAALVAAHERERCAQVCEDIDKEYFGDDVQATWCAQAIRALKD